jgi:hypothetical protein
MSEVKINTPIKEQKISIIVTRENGIIENLGVVSYWSTNPIKRFLFNLKQTLKNIRK